MDRVRPIVWGLPDHYIQWLEILSDMAEFSRQWRVRNLRKFSVFSSTQLITFLPFSHCFFQTGSRNRLTKVWSFTKNNGCNLGLPLQMELLFHEDIPMSTIVEQIEGCACKSQCCLTSTNQCRCRLRSTNPYNAVGLLTNFSASLFECNSNCVCEMTCPNRLVQVKHPIYRITEKSDVGKGLVANRDIACGEMICAYLGEVVPPEVGRLRELAQRKRYGRTYVLTMREYAHERLVAETCIDGDVSLPNSGQPDARLVNHSCDANVTVIPVRVDSIIPYAVLFANRFIPRDTELTYDYADGVPTEYRLTSGTQCRCNSADCMGYLPCVE
ncbi:unnamed protein product [Echinostoma caproni]|uniref:Histone-lysine N-methyltransferase SETMAR n=1 Tax=Echinostoma caproni TaxID=27848 RepID=A0A183AR82_9TREM|nr:unnamed protein product [Echinostoma caproni]